MLTFIWDLFKFLGFWVALEMVIWGILELIWKFNAERIMDFQIHSWDAEDEWNKRVRR